jgi:hypothetical protein
VNDVAIEDSSAPGSKRGYVSITDFRGIQGRKLLSSLRAKRPDGLLPIEHFHCIVEAEIAGEACSRLGVRSKAFIVGAGVL